MIVTCVSVIVKPEFIEKFIEVTVRNHMQSVKENGNLRFDVLQSIEDPAIFTLYEAYESAEASAAHKNTSHYTEWKDTVASMMAQPRVGIAHNVIAPSDILSWKK
jgi:(4S)-4-hydroxy-5-phosphonooxypentane-2,3-dione isomerase